MSKRHGFYACLPSCAALLTTVAIALAAGAAPAAPGGAERQPWAATQLAQVQVHNGEPGAEEEEPPLEEGIPYEARFEGVPEGDLLEVLRGSAQLVTLADRPPSTIAGLRRRAIDDVERLRTALRSEGYYASDVFVEIRAEEEPVKVVLQIETGAAYSLSEASVDYTREVDEDIPVPRAAEELGIELGARARAPRVLQAQRDLLRLLGERGYPDASVVDRRVVVDHDEETLSVRWRVDPGSFQRFGALRVEGLETVDADYIQGFREWEIGEVFDQRKVESTRRELMQTRLFAGVAVERGAPVDEETPITFRFEEREHRSIGFSARFSTSEGFGGRAFWEHRNFFSQNEQLRLSLDLAEIGQEVRADLRSPRFRRPDQDLIASTSLRRQETDAFDEEAIALFAGLERQLTETVRGSLGASIDLLTTEDAFDSREFLVWGLPGTLVRDTRDDILDPTDGTRLEYALTPMLSTIDETRPFVRNILAGSAYASLDRRDRFVLAGRGMVGSLAGADTLQIPASMRFFAGGGGSIRGFPFQLVGPLDEDDNPIGGRSIIELSGELRARVTDTIGIVPFIDAGNVFDSPYPDFSNTNDRRIRYAAGIGLRYFTPIGPLRFDIAVPINRRDVDSNFEIYISLGQAF